MIKYNLLTVFVDNNMFNKQRNLQLHKYNVFINLLRNKTQIVYKLLLVLYTAMSSK